jgi:hypothetical protein
MSLGTWILWAALIVVPFALLILLGGWPSHGPWGEDLRSERRKRRDAQMNEERARAERRDQPRRAHSDD